MDQNESLYKEVSELITFLGDTNPHFDMKKALKFAAGLKNEIYCKNRGLVYLEGKHNDGATTTLKLIQSNRVLENSYNYIKSGDWKYELDTGYRTPAISDSWLDDSSHQSFSLREFRKRDSGNDTGHWRFKWVGNDTSRSFSTRGETPEPLPMHMANDYHLWGSYDLGYKLKFILGHKDTVKGKENGASKDIHLVTQREVIQKLTKFTYKDSKNQNYEYVDCFKVRSIIQLDKNL